MAEITQKTYVAPFPLWFNKKKLGKGDPKPQRYMKDSKVKFNKNSY